MLYMSEATDGCDGRAEGLPTPDALALAHARRLMDLIDRHIDADGPLDFASFMQLALYAPGLGYYMAGAQKFGKAGDFITAPELGPLFGQSLAVQLTEIIANGVEATVLEVGAGSGALAASLLPEIARRLPTDSVPQYLILEPSAELQKRQQAHLKSTLDETIFGQLAWLDALPTDFNGVIIANEVIDAMPVTRFRTSESVQSNALLKQLAVDRKRDERVDPSPQNPGYFLTPVDASAELRSAVSTLEDSIGPLPAGYTSEINLLVEPWLRSLHACMNHGVVLLIDYGYPEREYYLPERDTGTLACYYQHRAHDEPLIYPGLQDITAHVDFSQVARAGHNAGFELLGYGSQAQFLLANDLSELAATAAETLNREVDLITLNKSIKTLTLPGEMGERFQVMAFGKGYDLGLRGFRSHDLSHRL